MPNKSPEDNHKVPDHRKTREALLAAERRKVLSLPSEQALDAVLASPYPVTLVQSMAEEDLYLLVHTIGLDDAVPVLGLASNDQWAYFLDMEIWSRDRIHPHALTEWLARLLKADPDRFTHWIVEEQRDVFQYYLYRNLEVHVREYEEDPSEIGDGFSTEDDVHYVRQRPYPVEYEHLQETRDQFVGDLLRRLAVYDYPLYKGLLVESGSVLATEAEEELLRLRNVRLAEKGFLPFEEAVGVYQPLSVADLLRRGRKPVVQSGRAVETYQPQLWKHADIPTGADRFTRTLAGVQDELTFTRLQTEFAGLCNQVITADLKQIRERETLAQVVSKVSGYIGIGLEKAEADEPGDDPYRSANLIQSYLLADIFRVGYGCALALKWKAERWRRESWFQRAGLPLAFWGESGLGVLGGLLIKKPLFFDNYAGGVLYREFSTLADIRSTEANLDRLIAFDDLLALMDIEIPRQDPETLITYQNVLLTLWADHCLGIDEKPSVPVPLSIDQLRALHDRLWEPGPLPRRIGDSRRAQFLDWLAQRSGLSNYNISERMGPALEDLFALLESELGTVAAKDLDARFMQLFLIKP
jgi:hypothetical protein